jgi:hypothetical protein
MTIVPQGKAVRSIVLEAVCEDEDLCRTLIAGEEGVSEEGDEVLSFTPILHELLVFLPLLSSSCSFIRVIYSMSVLDDLHLTTSIAQGGTRCTQVFAFFWL